MFNYSATLNKSLHKVVLTDQFSVENSEEDEANDEDEDDAEAGVEAKVDEGHVVLLGARDEFYFNEFEFLSRGQCGQKGPIPTSFYFRYFHIPIQMKNMQNST